MIKFFQKLKAKKGFTLVELIVVIAIIGVLAAILVPTMLGYVTNSRVTSADSTAASIAKEIDNFFTEADTNGYGMKRANAVVTINIDISGGSWTATPTNQISGTTPFNTGGGITAWAGGNGFATGTAKSSASGDGIDLLAITLANLFPDIQNAAVSAQVVGGHCIALAYSADTQSAAAIPVDTIYEAASADFAVVTDKTAAWDGNTAGIDSNGLIVGTSPKLSMSVS